MTSARMRTVARPGLACLVAAVAACTAEPARIDGGLDAVSSADAGVDAPNREDGGDDGGADASVSADAYALDVGSDAAEASDAGWPSLQLTPTRRNFGAVITGCPSTPVDFVLTNTGSAPTGVVSVTLEGSDAAEFAVTSDLCSAMPLGAGASCTVTLAFVTGPPGAVTAVLVATASPGGTASSDLTATTIFSQALLSTPNSHDYGSVSVGTTSAATTYTVTNAWCLPVGPLGVGLAGANPGDFAIGADACTGSMLAAGASCTVDVRFAPTAMGARQADLAVHGAGSPSSADSSLSGAGAP